MCNTAVDLSYFINSFCFQELKYEIIDLTYLVFTYYFHSYSLKSDILS